MTQQGPKHILYVENGIGYGGAIICLRHLVRHLDRQQYLPMVVTGRTGPQYQEIANEALWQHIPDRLVDIVGLQRILAQQTWPDNIPGLRWFSQQILARFDDLCNFLPFFLRLLWTAWKFKADLIHANNEPLCNRAALLVAKCLRIPSVCHVRGDQTGSKMMQWAYSLPDHFISVSHWVAQSMQSKVGIPPEKISVIYDGIALDQLDLQADGRAFRERFNIPQDAFVVGLVGLLIPWKGQEMFIEAAKSLKDRIPDLKMLIIGGTPEDCKNYEAHLHQLTKLNYLEEIILFTGHVSKMEAVYNGVDIVVSASTQPEPLGTVVIESMAMGRPLIVPNHGGGSEMVTQGETGIVFDSGNAESLAQKISVLNSNRDLMMEIGINAQRHASKLFSIESHVEWIEKNYESLLTINKN